LNIREFVMAREMRLDWRPAVVAISTALLLWGCGGDPGFAFFARNDSSLTYLVRLDGRITEAPDGRVLVVLEVPPLTSGEGFMQVGTWAGNVQLLSTDCAAIETFDPPVGGGVVWIQASGEASFVGFASAFPDRASSPGPALSVLASVRRCGGEGGNGLLNQPANEP
jgi:hypothetical protein